MKKEDVILILKKELNSYCKYINKTEILTCGKFMVKKEKNIWKVIESREKDGYIELNSFEDEDEANDFFYETIKNYKWGRDFSESISLRRTLTEIYVYNVPKEQIELFERYYKYYFNEIYSDILSKHYGTLGFKDILKTIEHRAKLILLNQSFEEKLKHVQNWNNNNNNM